MSEIPSEVTVPARMLERQREALVAHVAGAGRRRVQRRVAIAAIAVVLLAALVAAPALGLSSRLADLFEGEPAPPSVQFGFSTTDEVRKRFVEAGPRDRYSRILVEEARGVISLETPDALIRLWAAPTEDGRQCSLVDVGYAPGARVHGPTSCDPLNADSGSLGVWWAPRPVGIVHVRVYADDVVQVEVHAENGDVRRLPVVAGHALGAIERDAVVSLVIGRDAGGNEVARFPSP